MPDGQIPLVQVPSPHARISDAQDQVIGHEPQFVGFNAAINSRRMAKPCVTGCETLVIDKEAETLRVDSFQLGPGDVISIDGYSGEVFLGAVDIIDPGIPETAADPRHAELERYVNTYLTWQKQAG